MTEKTNTDPSCLYVDSLYDFPVLLFTVTGAFWSTFFNLLNDCRAARWQGEFIFNINAIKVITLPY